ncbi:hypothetical protein HN832_02345 [archaeon]|jgi:hypothetical protein|nr:hypothetical protein [archaeon]MBT4373194.1 hypothetical protein [archaeon]MBT4531539.1 hypothetical protein [archaeon]MBT7001283.1 hypothetical protein [archaeon]MBT7282231.1 hypothetical protein [archaeon]
MTERDSIPQGMLDEIYQYPAPSTGETLMVKIEVYHSQGCKNIRFRDVRRDPDNSWNKIGRRCAPDGQGIVEGLLAGVLISEGMDEVDFSNKFWVRAYQVQTPNLNGGKQ